jgi:hypothetical protein
MRIKNLELKIKNLTVNKPLRTFATTLSGLCGIIMFKVNLKHKTKKTKPDKIF